MANSECFIDSSKGNLMIIYRCKYIEMVERFRTFHQKGVPVVWIGLVNERTMMLKNTFSRYILSVPLAAYLETGIKISVRPVTI